MTLFIKNYFISYLCNCEESIHHTIISLFHPNSLKEIKESRSRINPNMVKGTSARIPEKLIDSYNLSIQSNELLIKLELFGITDELANQDFLEALKLNKTETQDQINQKSRDPIENGSFPTKPFYTLSQKLKFYDNSNIQCFFEATKKIIDNNLTHVIEESISTREQSGIDTKIIIPRNITNPWEMILIDSHFEEFPHLNKLCLLRNLLRSTNENVRIECRIDPTDFRSPNHQKLISLLHDTDRSFSTSYQKGKKISIFTEGKTDAKLLEKAFGMMYPFLTDAFDFDGHVHFEGGATLLRQRIESLIGMNSTFKVIAMFDNDGKGRSEQSKITKNKLPHNIKASNYPDVNFARAYPCLRNSQISNEDINGTGAFLELYLGQQNILNGDKELPPMIIDPKNQGSFVDTHRKKAIQRNFEKNLIELKHESPENIISKLPETNEIFLHIFELCKNQ
ncbi:MAG: hypothetical protein HRT72_12055 [Flavobacteriales bacterium]|nr:hypothetical protein [Flavobacteriales bacterium]